MRCLGELQKLVAHVYACQQLCVDLSSAVLQPSPSASKLSQAHCGAVHDYFSLQQVVQKLMLSTGSCSLGVSLDTRLLMAIVSLCL